MNTYRTPPDTLRTSTPTDLYGRPYHGRDIGLQEGWTTIFIGAVVFVGAMVFLSFRGTGMG